ncbi:DUF418 domain-containing protein [Psychrobium sp. 1_MG-2023]|uniref:DUF418 domain-containing protein n=1 Tax=Psychrobium sp. 1_MG-2023 TaxID=3062624 RepID=UPI000C33BBD8|nr:DUF418 domain-containing protein [Psychrobium sp. 1_MG-2023]MDP2560460.1 DUF418 domain-containing protein [Psychrobium sp. 1_MG-2023]PKF57880.1 hypothetical protein CW748_05010 [Alteromonadales bacterium alter-6D02]
MESPNRIASLDLLRGIAILGILFMNIVAFGAPEIAYISPAWLGEISLGDKLAYSGQFIFANARFISLFCILFGAGLVLYWQKLEQKNIAPLPILKTRLHWLLLFGSLHLTILFFGDILLTYAICGLIVLNKVLWTQEKLMRNAIIYLTVGFVLFTGVAALMLLPSPDEEIFPLVLTEAKAAVEIANATGSFIEMIFYNLAYGVPLVLGLVLLFWFVGGLMLLGMALLKNGFFERGFSNKLEVVLIVSGLILSATQLSFIWQTDFLSAFFLLLPVNQLAAIFITLGVSSRLIKMVTANNQLLLPLQYAGKMAFSLYIFQSIVMTLLFRVFMPELFGALSRTELLGVALVMTIIQLVIATFWQTKIGQGPLEKIWRRLIAKKLNAQAA